MLRDFEPIADAGLGEVIVRNDQNCVHRAASVEEADIVVAWLGEEGINAFVKNRHAIGTLYTPIAIAPKGVEVCVFDEQQAARAIILLANHVEKMRRRSLTAPTGKVSRAVCEECGRPTDFPSELLGSVQTCPHCRANMDVADPPAFC